MSTDIEAGPLMLAAVAYTAGLGWPIVPGPSGGRNGLCSCAKDGSLDLETDRFGCPHRSVILRTADQVCDWWERSSDDDVLAPVGYSFDAVELPEVPALEVRNPSHSLRQLVSLMEAARRLDVSVMAVPTATDLGSTVREQHRTQRILQRAGIRILVANRGRS